MSALTSTLAQAGRWVTAKQYGEIFQLSEQTLSNWRFLDRRAGRKAARPGLPIYRYFGGTVRYYLPAEDLALVAGGQPQQAGQQQPEARA